jgi:hypothetical protein
MSRERPVLVSADRGLQLAGGIGSRERRSKHEALELGGALLQAKRARRIVRPNEEGLTRSRQ